MTATHPLLSLLTEIEQALKQQQLWQSEPLSAQALAYTEPFGIDTMSFENWLQFVLIPRIGELLAQQQPLPVGAQIAEMAEVVWANDAARLPLVELLRAFDQQLNKPTLLH